MATKERTNTMISQAYASAHNEAKDQREYSDHSRAIRVCGVNLASVFAQRGSVRGVEGIDSATAGWIDTYLSGQYREVSFDHSKGNHSFHVYGGNKNGRPSGRREGPRDN